MTQYSPLGLIGSVALSLAIFLLTVRKSFSGIFRLRLFESKAQQNKAELTKMDLLTEQYSKLKKRFDLAVESREQSDRDLLWQDVDNHLNLSVSAVLDGEMIIANAALRAAIEEAEQVLGTLETVTTG